MINEIEIYISHIPYLFDLLAIPMIGLDDNSSHEFVAMTFQTGGHFSRHPISLQDALYLYYTG